MSRIIINNKSDISDEDALRYVINVVRAGRISNEGKQYCYLTSFSNPDIDVVTDLRKKSDSFTIYDQSKKDL